MADLAVAHENTVLKTTGVGSCVVVTLYDPVKKIGGMAHAMLPSKKLIEKKTFSKSSKKSKKTNTSSKYADEAIEILIEKINNLGGSIKNLKAKLIGGSKMFKILSGDNQGIGFKNTEAARKKLLEKGIQIESEDIGGTVGRSVEFNIKNGLVSVSTKI